MNNYQPHTLYAAVLGLLSVMPIQTVSAATIATYAFHADTTDCFAQMPEVCPVIVSHGLSGHFQVDLDDLDATATGIIPSSAFLAFEATNGISSWNLTNVVNGGIAFSNGTPSAFGLEALPDFSAGWTWPDNGGGETLYIAGVGVDIGGIPARTGASSEPGPYCPSTGIFYGADPSAHCPGGFVSVLTYGISAQYGTPSLQAVPVAPAAYLFGSGLLGLISVARRKAA